MRTYFENITCLNFVSINCPIIRQTSNSIIFRTVSDITFQGIVAQNIVALDGKYCIEVVIEAIGCTTYWYGNYDGYRKIELKNGINNFDVDICGQRNNFNIGIIVENLIMGKKIVNVQLKIKRFEDQLLIDYDFFKNYENKFQLFDNPTISNNESNNISSQIKESPCITIHNLVNDINLSNIMDSESKNFANIILVDLVQVPEIFYSSNKDSFLKKSMIEIVDEHGTPEYYVDIGRNNK
ncbi:MAG: hypothetical protein QXW79_00745 [Thermoplasmata archaeon]